MVIPASIFLFKEKFLVVGFIGVITFVFFLEELFLSDTLIRAPFSVAKIEEFRKAS